MSQHHVARVAARLFNTPLLLQPEAAAAIATNLAERWGVEPMADLAPIEASRFRGALVTRRDDARTMYRVENGVAAIPVHGELVNRGAWIGAASGLTSYEGLDAQLRAAAADPNVSGILLDMNSPGGEATGAMETGALVRAISRQKPVVAFVNGLAASAGYAIASGAGTIVTVPTGVLGSIGVVWMHLDRSAALAKAGVKPTLIHAGAHKVDGTSLRELPDDARARIQASINDFYDLFVQTVAAHRKLDAAAVRATEGGTMMGQGAVAAGLADRIGTYDDALDLAAGPLAAGVRGTAANISASRAHPLTIETAALSAVSGALATFDRVTAAAEPGEVYANISDLAALIDPAAVQAAVLADRARCAAILAHPEAKGREAQAQLLALQTEMTVDQATTLLALGPRAAPDAALIRRPRLYVPDPKIAPDAGESGGSGDAVNWAALADQINAEAGLASPSASRPSR